jgi:hypothetical protein
MFFALSLCVKVRVRQLGCCLCLLTGQDENEDVRNNPKDIRDSISRVSIILRKACKTADVNVRDNALWKILVSGSARPPERDRM